MLILTQDGHHILNLKNIEDIYLSYIEKENIIYCCINGCDEIKMGEYKDKERCKEVLKEIVIYYNTLKHKEVDALWGYQNSMSYVYEMPEE